MLFVERAHHVDPLGPGLLLPRGAVTALARAGPPVWHVVLSFPLLRDRPSQPSVDTRDGPQRRDGAQPSVRLGDEGHLGDEVGPLAPLLYDVEQVDQGLDAFVAH
eukprot:7157515-Pyramimonas_sp.AAC.1